MPENKKIDPMWDDNPVDITKETNFIMSIANKLRGPYRSDKYKDVIIPMVIIRRFECTLASTKEAVVAQHKKNPDYPVKAMYQISGFQFYNTSEFNLAELLNDSDHLAENFKTYIQGFSPNVCEILLSEESGLNFFEQINKMDKNNRLFSIVKAFSELDLNPNTVDSIKMGYIFEDLIRRFSENVSAGDHYTGRDIIKLMVNVLLTEGCDDIFDDGKVITIVDQACGTGGMLSTAYNFIKRYNPQADVRMFGQEFDSESYAMCFAEMLIKGQDIENIRYQDTLKKDCFKDIKMRFVLENPPFGQPWSGEDAPDAEEKVKVKEEYKKGMSGRWGAGLPGGGDAQMLFLQSAVDKMDDRVGRCAIIENGSPLFTGGTSSGESQIRRWLLESDLIEAIIALPKDLFYNTGIATYIWILSKNKREERRGKIQLIDATSHFHKLGKSLGNKRNEISPEDRKAITELYGDFAENEYSKIYNNEEFLYREYTIKQPLQRNYCIAEDRIDGLYYRKVMSYFYNEAKYIELEEFIEGLDAKEKKRLEKYQNNKPLYDQIVNTLKKSISDTVYTSLNSFKPFLKEVLKDVTADKTMLERVAKALSEMDKTAEIQRKKNGDIIYDDETKDAEIVKYEENIDVYMEREVLPYIPDAVAFFEEDLSKKNPDIKTGAEIPFTRYFYKYVQPTPSEELEDKFMKLEKSVSECVAKLFK